MSFHVDSLDAEELYFPRSCSLKKNKQKKKLPRAELHSQKYDFKAQHESDWPDSSTLLSLTDTTKTKHQEPRSNCLAAYNSLIQ